MDTEPTHVPATADRHRPGPLVRALIVVVEWYRRWISPMFPPRCRFHPSCSAYAVDALRTHGLLRGAGLTLVRLAKCAPWHPGGLDPVPPRTPRCAGPTGAAAPTPEEQASC